jgi:hypothetical protein
MEQLLEGYQEKINFMQKELITAYDSGKQWSLKQSIKEARLLMNKLIIETVKEYVGAGHVKEALILVKNYYDKEEFVLGNTIVQLSARFIRNETDKNMGVKDSSQYSIERNRIIYSLFAIVDDMPVAEKSKSRTNIANVSGNGNCVMQGNSDNNITFGGYTITKEQFGQYKPCKVSKTELKLKTQTINSLNQFNMTTSEETLLLAAKKHERTNPEIAEEALTLLKEVRDFQDGIFLNTIADVSGDKRKALDKKVHDLAEKIKTAKYGKVEDFIKQVKELLTERIPSWENIEKAYILCKNRGLVNETAKTAIKEKPEDNEVKIRIVEIIESYIANN